MNKQVTPEEVNLISAAFERACAAFKLTDVRLEIDESAISFSQGMAYPDLKRMYEEGTFDRVSTLRIGQMAYRLDRQSQQASFSYGADERPTKEELEEEGASAFEQALGGCEHSAAAVMMALKGLPEHKMRYAIKISPALVRESAENDLGFVIAHELAHIRKGHVSPNRRIGPWQIVASAIDNAIFIPYYGVTPFSMLISRHNERVADITAARIMPQAASRQAKAYFERGCKDQDDVDLYKMSRKEWLEMIMESPLRAFMYSFKRIADVGSHPPMPERMKRIGRAAGQALTR